MASIEGQVDPKLLAARKLAAPPPPGKPHGFAVEGSQEPGYSSIYRSWRAPKTGPLVHTINPEVSS